MAGYTCPNSRPVDRTWLLDKLSLWESQWESQFLPAANMERAFMRFHYCIMLDHEPFIVDHKECLRPKLNSSHSSILWSIFIILWYEYTRNPNRFDSVTFFIIIITLIIININSIIIIVVIGYYYHYHYYYDIIIIIIIIIIIMIIIITPKARWFLLSSLFQLTTKGMFRISGPL